MGHNRAPAYYNRFWFKATRHFGVSCSIDIPEDLPDCVIVSGLPADALKGVSGVVNFNM